MITVESGRNVDVYNFADLIEDILDLAPAMNPDMNDTQTSELVYLMQQYEKYTDGFVDVIEPRYRRLGRPAGCAG